MIRLSSIAVLKRHFNVWTFLSAEGYILFEWVDIYITIFVQKHGLLARCEKQVIGTCTGKNTPAHPLIRLNIKVHFSLQCLSSTVGVKSSFDSVALKQNYLKYSVPYVRQWFCPGMMWNMSHLPRFIIGFVNLPISVDLNGFPYVAIILNYLTNHWLFSSSAIKCLTF